jgi:hypothetical protein
MCGISRALCALLKSAKNPQRMNARMGLARMTMSISAPVIELRDVEQFRFGSEAASWSA